MRQESIAYFTSTPFYTLPEAKHYTNYIFDPIGRVIETINPDGTSIKQYHKKKSIFFIDSNKHLSERYADKNIIINRKYEGDYLSLPASTELLTPYTEETIYKAKDGSRIIDIEGNTIETNADIFDRKISYSDPDIGEWIYTYDINGNLSSQTDAEGNITSFTYDLLNRIVTKSNETTINYFYDESDHGFSNGKLTRVMYSGGAESYDYDMRGRVVSATQDIGSRSATQKYEYDSLDRLIKTIYPTGEEIINTYGEDLNLLNMGKNSMSDSIDYYYVNNFQYTVQTHIKEMTFGNGLKTVYNYYDSNFDLDPIAGTCFSSRLRSIELYNAAGLMLQTQYQYDKMGNIKYKELRDIPANLVSTEQYNYDHFDRLVSTNSYGVHGFNQYASEIFEYDNLNNITRKYKNVEGNIDDRTYSYDNTKVHAVINDGIYTYQYDNNGNMTGRFDSEVLNRGFQYDGRNRVSSITDGGYYAYNDGEQRIYKNENGIETYYFFPNYEEEVSASETLLVSYYFANDLRIAKRTQTQGQSETTLTYIHSDHLQSAVRVTDSDGFTIQTIIYTAFGEQGFATGVQDLKYTYTNQELESNGLMYYGARFYDPALGRFLQADTILDGLNRYAYCGNNPIIYSDPTGHWRIDLFFIQLAGGEDSKRNGFDLSIGFGADCSIIELSMGSEGFYLEGTVPFIIQSSIEFDKTGLHLSTTTLVGAFYIDIDQYGLGVELDALLVGMKFNLGPDTYLEADCTIAGFHVGNDSIHGWNTFTGGSGYDFKSGRAFKINAGVIKLFGVYGGPGYTGGKVAGEPGYPGTEGFDSVAWVRSRDEVDEAMKVHDHDWYYLVQDHLRTLDICDRNLINACMDNVVRNNNPWAKTKGLLAAIYFSLANRHGYGD